MKLHPVESARAKLDRAQHQLDELRAQLKIGWEQHLYGIGARDDLQSHETIVICLKPRDLFIRYSVLAGEVVHHMRSALDHIVWQTVPNPIEGTTGFPIFSLEDKDPADPNKRYYKGHGLCRMIKDIDPALEAVIRRFQPFATSADQRLALLNEMWKWDKHRLLNIMVVLPQAISPFYRYADGRMVFRPTMTVPEVDHGAEIGRIPHPPDFVPGKVHMEAEVAIAVRFVDAGAAVGQSPEELLADLLKLTTGIVDEFASKIP